MLVVVGLASTALAEVAAAPAAGHVDGVYGPHLPENITPPGSYGQRVDSLIHILHYFMLLLFIGWGAYFVYCLVRFRQRPGHRAAYQPVKATFTKYAELGVIGFEAFLLLGLSIPIWADVKNDLPVDKNPVRVRVVAEQFAWNFHYPGPDNEFGRTDPKFIDTATNPVGRDPNDAHGKDDIVSGEFRFPVGRPVLAEISSKDVIHSFWLPVLRVKQDAIPGMRIPVWFESAKVGRYQVACAQLCGNNHYKMLAPMVITTQPEFEKWMAEKSKPPEEFTEE